MSLTRLLEESLFITGTARDEGLFLKQDMGWEADFRVFVRHVGLCFVLVLFF